MRKRPIDESSDCLKNETYRRVPRIVPANTNTCGVALCVVPTLPMLRLLPEREPGQCSPGSQTGGIGCPAEFTEELGIFQQNQPSLVEFPTLHLQIHLGRCLGRYPQFRDARKRLTFSRFDFSPGASRGSQVTVGVHANWAVAEFNHQKC
eukprot:s399_g49.t1